MKKKIPTDEMLEDLPNMEIFDFMKKYNIGRTATLRFREECGIKNKGLFLRKKHIFINGVECKECSKCKKPLKLSAFGKADRNWDKLNNWCMECERKRNIERNKKKETKKYQVEYKRKRRKEPYYRIMMNVRCGITRFVKNENITKSKYTEYIGCDIPFFVEYLKSKFKPGMTLENYGTIWHIDHIIPTSYFGIDEIKTAWHYTNLQPLFKIENILKSDKLPNGKRVRDCKHINIKND